MSIERDYNDLLDFAAKLITKNKSNLSAGDLVNEGYSRLGGKPYSKNMVMKMMQAFLFEEKRFQEVIFEFGKPVYADTFINDAKICSKCNELLPISSFRIKGVRPSYACRKCESKMASEWRKKKGKKTKKAHAVPTKKYCNKCKSVKDIGEFSVIKRGDKKHYFYCCKACQRDIMRRRQGYIGQ